MTKTRLGALFALLFAAAGCESPPMSGHAEIYQAIIQVFIEEEVCNSFDDCQRKQLIYWEAGGGRMYFTIYSSTDAKVRAKVEKAVIEAKARHGVRHPVTLAFHTESKADALREVLPPRASYIKEID